MLLGPLQEAVAPALPKVRGHIGSAYGEEDAREAGSSSLFGGDGSSDDTHPSSGSGHRSSVASSQKRRTKWSKERSFLACLDFSEAQW
uniref:Uncharacterized protein n=1 Tax=Zea mays TaxID=4577 RepID=A0A804NVH3_MAIZE